ncbi:MAG: hypothetical protein KF858_10610 [Candidatus Sumerlaeia bacterium]|nr:hypothetical protein [Candidatus Sumerlaeia bacterium]
MRQAPEAPQDAAACIVAFVELRRRLRATRAVVAVFGDAERFLLADRAATPAELALDPMQQHQRPNNHADQQHGVEDEAAAGDGTHVARSAQHAELERERSPLACPHRPRHDPHDHAKCQRRGKRPEAAGNRIAHRQAAADGIALQREADVLHAHACQKCEHPRSRQRKRRRLEARQMRQNHEHRHAVDAAEAERMDALHAEQHEHGRESVVPSAEAQRPRHQHDDAVRQEQGELLAIVELREQIEQEGARGACEQKADPGERGVKQKRERFTRTGHAERDGQCQRGEHTGRRDMNLLPCGSRERVVRPPIGEVSHGRPLPARALGAGPDAASAHA